MGDSTTELTSEVAGHPSGHRNDNEIIGTSGHTGSKTDINNCQLGSPSNRSNVSLSKKTAFICFLMICVIHVGLIALLF